jgi:predicted CoA-binding protein
MSLMMDPRYTADMSDRHRNLVTSPGDIAGIVRAARRIAVLGIKTEQQRDQPAFYVPEYMLRAGYDIVPVPVYYPDVTEILGQKVYRSISLIPGHVDMVNVFRRARDIPPHLPDILNARPTVVWFQLGIVNDDAALTLARAGIQVVQDRCLLVEHRRLQ